MNVGRAKSCAKITVSGPEADLALPAELGTRIRGGFRVIRKYADFGPPTPGFEEERRRFVFLYSHTSLENFGPGQIFVFTAQPQRKQARNGGSLVPELHH